MIRSLYGIVFRSLKFYRKQALYQFLIITLLCAVITGSLLTGSSVRTSLKSMAAEKLGPTRFLISSGNRFFSTGLSSVLNQEGLDCAGFLELKGSVINLKSQESLHDVAIHFIDSTIFPFLKVSRSISEPGTVIINTRLSEQLNLNVGDEIVLRFRSVSDIPADAPFSPEDNNIESIVLKVGSILPGESGGNFSLEISQVTPLNVFANFTDTERQVSNTLKHNRIIVGNDNKIDTKKLAEILGRLLEPSHIGLRIRTSTKTGEAELISDRVFIDSALSKSILQKIPGSSPVITYLANSIGNGERSTPYSFISSLSPSMYDEIPDGGIVINSWLSEDLGSKTGDSLLLRWYSPDSLNNLIEKQEYFTIRKVVSSDYGIWGDSLLMPEFPGIAGKESCSQWDAGISIDMKRIRIKDEDYWNKYKGTPKGFINYNTGKRIWGSNFGPVTSIRFDNDLSEEDILGSLAGSFDPLTTGFTVSDILTDSIAAADKSVDFGTLFISLGFFLILAAFILLWLSVSHDIEIRSPISLTLFSLGFRRKRIRHLLFSEFFITVLSGCIAGALAGYLINILIIKALNSIWTGAVQTSTLSSAFSLSVVFTGFIIFLVSACIFLYLVISSHTKRIFKDRKSRPVNLSVKTIKALAVTSFAVTAFLFIFSTIYTDYRISLCFISGSLLMITCILVFWLFLSTGNNKNLFADYRDLSKVFYARFPLQGILPVLLIALGIFSFMITSVNRKDFNSMSANRSSGTGGFSYWIESSLPVLEDLNTVAGRRNAGLDEEQLCNLQFVQMKKLEGNDASCLNLNHITTPPLLGINPEDFISRKSFSFASSLSESEIKDPWEYLSDYPGSHIIYGIADQTVMDWGLKISTGDTLIIRAENGQPLKIIIAAGLKSSVFQGYLLIGMENFRKYFPSVPGHSIMLADANGTLIPDTCMKILEDRLSTTGVIVSKTTSRLESFYLITNTYLSVFGVFGGLGLIIGIAGLGIVLLRNYNNRKREFALMIATGFSFRIIKIMILSEQVMILAAGIFTGLLSAIIATLPSLRSNNDIPWIYVISMIALVVISGIIALWFSVRSVKRNTLITSLRKD